MVTEFKTIEKRSHHRHLYLAEAIYGNDNEIGRGLVQDLSLGGVYISSEPKVPLGAEMLVTIPFSKIFRYVSLRGIVIRTAPGGFALAFSR